VKLVHLVRFITKTHCVVLLTWIYFLNTTVFRS